MMRWREIEEQSIAQAAPPAAPDDIALFEMANLDKSDTGIDGMVYVSTPQGSHAPRVKWYPGRPSRRAPCLSVTIAAMPEVRNHRLPQTLAHRMAPIVSGWVKLNHHALLKFWQQGTSWSRQEVNAHFDQLKKWTG